jgi:hypothetical protein
LNGAAVLPAALPPNEFVYFFDAGGFRLTQAKDFPIFFANFGA